MGLHGTMDFKDVKRILIIKLRHIGDVLLTVPTIRAVRETFPEAYIAVLVNRGTEEMLTGNPLINEVISYNRRTKTLPLPGMILEEIRFAKYIRSKAFDMTVDLTSGDRAALYSYLSGARYRIAYNPEGRGFPGKSRIYTHIGRMEEGRVHTVVKDIGLVRQFGMDTDNLSLNIYFSEDDRRHVEDILEKNGVRKGDTFFHIHPTSRWLFKCWKDEYMAGVIDYLEGNAGVRTVVTSGNDKREMDRVKNILSLARSAPIDLSGLLTLKQLAQLSERASLFFGVDSAPMHIAAAVGTPVIALFGPSGAFNWGPWDNEESSKFKVQSSKLESEGTATEYVFGTPYPERNGIQRSNLHTVIQRDWDCIPCGRDGCEGSKRSECLEDIKAEEVIEVLKERIDRLCLPSSTQNRPQAGVGRRTGP